MGHGDEAHPVYGGAMKIKGNKDLAWLVPVCPICSKSHTYSSELDLTDPDHTLVREVVFCRFSRDCFEIKEMPDSKVDDEPIEAQLFTDGSLRIHGDWVGGSKPLEDAQVQCVIAIDKVQFHKALGNS